MQQLQAIAFDPRIRLGQGGSGSVFVGTWNDQNVAVKRVQSIDIDEKEEQALRQLTHSNVVELLHVESDNAFKYFALELCEASLDQLFPENDDTKRYSGPPLPHSFTVLSQLASGLEYIHSKNLIHRDVKPENVLIHVDSDKKVTMKWADFGLSKPVNERGTYTMSGIRGTMSWMAPELLKQQQPRPLRGTIKSDVFAEGCVFGYFLSKGKHPFGNLDWEIPSNIATSALKNVGNDVIESSYARELILKMLDKEYTSRITSKQVCEQLESDMEKLRQMEPKLFEYLKAPQVDLEEVKKLLHEGVDVNCENADKCTPLLYLAKNSRGKINLKETIELLLSFPVDVNKKEKRGYNALLFLCWFYQQRDLIDILRLLIDKGIKVDQIELNENCNALHLLCENYRIDNLIDIIQLLIDNKMEINDKNKGGWNALHIVCQHYKNENLLDIVRLLIEKGIDFKSSEENEMKCNVLHLLCENYREKNLIDIIQLLIEREIDVNSRNKDGWNGLHLACKHYDKDDLIRIVELFIKSGINVNSTEKRNGRNALHLVCENYQSNKLINIIEHLVVNEIHIKTRNTDGWNALHLVCKNYKNENLIHIVQFLIENGIKAYSKTNKGWNALLILCKNYFNANLIEIVQLLIENGMDLNWKNDKRWNALHLLCKYYSNVNLIEIIQLLIEHKIDLNCTTNEGNALFLLCKYYPNKNLIELLRLFISKGITVKWNDIDPRNLIRRNPNQKCTGEYVQLFEPIILPTTKVQVVPDGNHLEVIAIVPETQSNGHSH